MDIKSTMGENIAGSGVRSVNARIADRVRARRRELGMSLDSLASRSAVSRSMISLVERGESSPTAVVLEKIAAGLGLPLGKLFDDPSAHADPISRGADRTPWRDPQSGYVRRNVSPPNFPSPIQLVEVVMPAGASVAYENAARGVRIHQQIWVTEGTIEVTVGEEPHRLSRDDCFAMELNGPTAFRNPTRRPARYVVVVATERGHVSRR